MSNLPFTEIVNFYEIDAFRKCIDFMQNENFVPKITLSKLSISNNLLKFGISLVIFY